MEGPEVWVKDRIGAVNGFVLVVEDLDGTYFIPVGSCIYAASFSDDSLATWYEPLAVGTCCAGSTDWGSNAESHHHPDPPPHPLIPPCPEDASPDNIYFLICDGSGPVWMPYCGPLCPPYSSSSDFTCEDCEAVHELHYVIPNWYDKILTLNKDELVECQYTGDDRFWDEANQVYVSVGAVLTHVSDPEDGWLLTFTLCYETDPFDCCVWDSDVLLQDCPDGDYTITGQVCGYVTAPTTLSVY